MEPREFAYDRGAAPMMWVLFALSLIELLAVHLLVATWWPAVGWPLSILGAAATVGIFVVIRSLSTCPHRLEAERLVLRFGSLKSVNVALADIAAVQRQWEAGAVSAKDGINLAGLAYPNRCIALARPLARGRRRVFVRLDDPEAFDAALALRGVAFG